MNVTTSCQTNTGITSRHHAEGRTSQEHINSDSAHWTKNAQARTDALRAFQRRLVASQWFSSEKIAGGQERQLAALLAHAKVHSPYYKRIFDQIGPREMQRPFAWLCEIPPLHRETLLSHYADLCAAPPARHGKVREQHSSGSTGQPVWLRRTDLCHMIWMGLTLRDHLWHRRDFSGTLAAIRVVAGQPNRQAKRFTTWGEVVSACYASGPMHVLPISTDVHFQSEWLASINPEYLLSYPSNLIEVLRVARQENRDLLHLREIRTFGETVTETLREEVASLPGVKHTDIYSSQELGIIALQCPESGLYHIQSENVVVELINEVGQRCLPGEVGRVIVTDLHNYAFPLIRYDLGDYAEAGPPCPCGRGLPTLRRILGRRRNMVVLPNGQRHWPYVSASLIREAMPLLKQCQLIQSGTRQIEVRVVVGEEARGRNGAQVIQVQEKALGKTIQNALGYPFEIRFQYQTGTLEKGRNGKFEEVVCTLP